VFYCDLDLEHVNCDLDLTCVYCDLDLEWANSDLDLACVYCDLDLECVNSDLDVDRNWLLHVLCTWSFSWRRQNIDMVTHKTKT